MAEALGPTHETHPAPPAQRTTPRKSVTSGAAVPLALSRSPCGLGGAKGDRRALVVDDDPEVCATLEWMLDGLGYAARSVHSVSAFREAWRNGPPDLLIVDLFLGGDSGLDALRGIEADRAVGVIVTSGSGARLLGAARQSAEAYGFSVLGELAKPFRVKCLRAVLESGRADDHDIHPAPVPAAAAMARAWRAPADPEVIAAAIRDRTVRAAFQPQVHAATGKPLGFEALARWQHPQLGALSPAAFLPAIEATGFQTALALAMLAQSCDLLAQVTDRDIRVSVNITADVGCDPTFRTRACDIVQRHGLHTGRIMLEVVEAGLAPLTQEAIDGLIDLHMAGFGLSIDDFGVGQSSLVRLMRVPFAELKVDRSIVLRATLSAEGRAIVQTLADLGTRLGLTVVAEGIEDVAAARMMCSVGCTALQGYLYGRAMPPDAAHAWLHAARQ